CATGPAFCEGAGPFHWLKDNRQNKLKYPFTCRIRGNNVMSETADNSSTPQNNGPKVYVATWGCQMNEYDSARMVDVLAKNRGATRVDAPEQADIILLNTCSVREKAQEKVFSQLGRWQPLKQANPDLVIG